MTKQEMLNVFAEGYLAADEFLTTKKEDAVKLTVDEARAKQNPYPKDVAEHRIWKNAFLLANITLSPPTSPKNGWLNRVFR